MNYLPNYSVNLKTRNKSNAKALVGFVVIAILAFSLFGIQSASAATTTCSTSGAVGSASLPVTIDAASTSTLWVLISNTTGADLELKVDGNQCVRQTFTAASATASWQKFTVNFTLGQGSHQLTISSFSNAVTLQKIAVVNDGQIPTGDGSNLTTIINTTPCATTGILGTATLNTSLDADATSSVWFLVANTSNADLEFNVDGSKCVRQTFAPTGTTLTWQKFNTTLNLTKGTHTLKVNSFSNGVMLSKIAIVSDGTVPVGDGTNVTTTITTQPPVTTQPPTTKAPGTTAPPTTQTATTKAPVTTRPPTTVTTTTKVPVTTRPPTTVTPTTKAPQGTNLVALNKIKADFNLQSIKQTSFNGTTLTGRAYHKYQGFLYIAQDFVATVSSDGSYVINSFNLILSFTPIS